MEDELPFSGSALNVVDSKGRVSLYAPFREQIAARCAHFAPGDMTADDKLVYLTLPKEMDRLVATDVIGLRQRAAELRAAVLLLPPAEQAAARIKAGRAMGNAMPVSFDAAGRLVLPAKLRKAVGIGDHVLFWGGFDRMEMWDPARARHAFVDEPGDVAVIEQMMEDRGIAF